MFRALSLALYLVSAQVSASSTLPSTPQPLPSPLRPCCAKLCQPTSMHGPAYDARVEEQARLYADARRLGQQQARANASAPEPQHHQIRMPRTLATRGLYEATWRAYFIDGWRDVRPDGTRNAHTAHAAAPPPTAIQADQERRFGLALVGYANGRYSLVPEPFRHLLEPLGINEHHPQYARLVQDYNAAHREAGGRDMGQAPTPPPQPPTTGWSLFWWIGNLDARSELHGSQNEAQLNAAAISHLQSIFGTHDIQDTSGSHPDTLRALYRVGYVAGRQQRGGEIDAPAGRTNSSPPAQRPTPPQYPSPPEEYRRANGTMRSMTRMPSLTQASAFRSAEAYDAGPSSQRTAPSEPRRHGFSAPSWHIGTEGPVRPSPALPSHSLHGSMTGQARQGSPRMTRPPAVSRPPFAGGDPRIMQPMPRRVTHPPAIPNSGSSRSSSRGSLSNDDLYANPSPPPLRRVSPMNPAVSSRSASSNSSPLTATRQLRTTQMTTTGSGGSPRPTSTLSRIRPDSSLASTARVGTRYVDAVTQVPPSGVPLRRDQQVQQRRSLQSLLSPNPPTTTSELTAGTGVFGTFGRTSRPPGSALSRIVRSGRQSRQ